MSTSIVRTDLLDIGRTGLEAARTKLTVTGHNIANVDTPGYTRQETTQQAIYSSRDNYVGAGTTVLDIRRVYSDHLTTQLRRTTSLNSEATAYQTQIESLDTVLASSTTSLSGSLDSFFASLQTAADDPANTASRQLVLADADALAKRFNSLHDTLSTQQSSVNSQITSSVDQINSLAKQIGQMNETIAKAVSAGDNPNDLMDRRDQAILDLSKHIGATVVEQDQGTLNVFVGSSGFPLVVGKTVNQLSAAPSDSDPSQMAISFVSGGDGTKTLMTDQLLVGGELGGLIRFRNEALTPALNSLGQMALAFGESVNEQLGKGLDLAGNAGVALFADINTTDMMTRRVVVSGQNTSDTFGQLEITDANKLTASDYEVRYDGSAYTAIRLSDSKVMTVTDTAGTLTFQDSSGVDQGISLTFASAGGGAASLDAGDVFTLKPTQYGASEIATAGIQAGQLALAAPLKSSSNLQNVGTGVLGQPTLTSVTDGSSQTAALLPDDLETISPLTFTYNSTSGTLDATLPSLPSGWAASISSTSLSVTSGEANTLSYTLTVNNGSTTTNYAVEQSFSGIPANGDTFTLSLNENGVSDNRNALALIDLQDQKIVNVASASSSSITDAYGSVIESVGTQTAAARNDASTTESLLTYAQDSRDSYSGVSLDEEASNLIKFQQYYNASAQVIQSAQEMFDTLLASLR